MGAEIYCRVRGKVVVLTPEERVRQTVLQMMFEQGGYPLSLVAVEVSISDLMAGQSRQGLRQARRIDIACFAAKEAAEGSKELMPLLLVECKAKEISEEASKAALKRALRQAFGYNFFLQAPFVALASQSGIFLSRWNRFTESFEFIKGLPSYSSLLKSLQP